MKIFPAIDLIDGKCVRLERGDYSRKTEYHSDPVEVAQRFEDNGIRYLHLVDLDGAKQGKLVNIRILEAICSKTRLRVDIGGGIKQVKDLQAAFDAGAAKVNIGSLAVKAPEVLAGWLQQYDPEKFILSADVNQGHIAIHGWQTTTDWNIQDFISHYIPKGIQTVTSTEISRDGMLTGPATELYEELRHSFPQVQLIASGGIRNMEDLATLAEMGMYGAIVGKAIYEGHIQLKELGKAFGV